MAETPAKRLITREELWELLKAHGIEVKTWRSLQAWHRRNGIELVQAVDLDEVEAVIDKLPGKGWARHTR